MAFNCFEFQHGLLMMALHYAVLISLCFGGSLMRGPSEPTNIGCAVGGLCDSINTTNGSIPDVPT